MARGGRRVGGGGGRRGCGEGLVPGSAENITSGWRYAAVQVWMRQMIEQKQSTKRVIEPSNVDPERDSRMMDDMHGSVTGLTDSWEIEKFGPLHEAASMEKIDICKYLLENLGLDINAVANNDSGITPLGCAVLCGKAITVRYLLDKGADPEKEDIIGCTPLHYAAKQGNDGLVRLLLSKGASVNASSSEGTPLHFFETKAKALPFPLIKKKVSGLLKGETGRKTIQQDPTPRRKAHTTSKTTDHKERQDRGQTSREREDAVTTKGGADTGRSSEDEEATPLKCPQHSLGAAAPTSIYSTTPSRPPSPPSGTAIPTYHRSHSSHDAARRSHPQPKLHKVNCSQSTAAAPTSGAAAPA